MSGPRHIPNPFSIKLCGLEIQPITVKLLELVRFSEQKKHQNITAFLIGHFIGFHCICPIASKGLSIPFICTCHYLHVLLVVCSNPEKVDCIRINTLVFGLLQYLGFECYNCTSCIVARLDLVVSTSQIGFFSWRFTRFERQRIYETNKNPMDSSGWKITLSWCFKCLLSCVSDNLLFRYWNEFPIESNGFWNGFGSKIASSIEFRIPEDFKILKLFRFWLGQYVYHMD